MDTRLNIHLGDYYKSNSQKARVITEGWIAENAYCPICGRPHICHFDNNRPVADFFCPNCKAEYELKSKKGLGFGKIINDGAYATMIERINEYNNPNLICMTHSDSVVNNLVYIPRHFFTPDIIIQRKPLASSARRAGWIGCNINIQKIPQSGKIYIIRNSVVQDVNNVVEQSKKAELLETKLKERGWLFDIIRCVESVKTEYFTLAQVYSFESILQKLHPENNNIRAKIRQQLQVLRDRGFLEFVERGVYRKL